MYEYPADPPGSRIVAADSDRYEVDPSPNTAPPERLAGTGMKESPALKNVTRLKDEGGHEPAQGAALDRATLDRLARDVGEEILPELIDTFLEELDYRIDLIEQAAEAADLGTLVAQAHPLKSSAANFGAVALSRLASNIETAARAGDGSRAQAAARRARAIAKATRELLSAAIEI